MNTTDSYVRTLKVQHAKFVFFETETAELKIYIGFRRNKQTEGGGAVNTDKVLQQLIHILDWSLLHIFMPKVSWFV